MNYDLEYEEIIKSKDNEILELKKKLDKIEKAHGNLVRATIERANVDREQKPKKYYVGYILYKTNQTIKKYHNKINLIDNLDCYYSEFITPYTYDLSLEDVRELVLYDFENYLIDNISLLKFMGLDYCFLEYDVDKATEKQRKIIDEKVKTIYKEYNYEPGVYYDYLPFLREDSIDPQEVKKIVEQKVNSISAEFGWGLRVFYNGKFGYWCISFFHTKPLVNDMRLVDSRSRRENKETRKKDYK